MNLNQFFSTGKLQDRTARLVYIWLTSDVKPLLLFVILKYVCDIVVKKVHVR